MKAQIYDGEVSMAYKVKSLENQLQFSQTTMGQYWLGKTKAKEAFRSTRNAFLKVATEFFLKSLFNGMFY